jgi:hypothetical protein
MELSWMFSKYSWYKEFGCSEKFEDLPSDEVDIIMMIGSRMKSAEVEMNERNRKK